MGKWTKALVTVGIIGVIMLIAFVWRTFQHPCSLNPCYQMNGLSMRPSLQDGDQIVVDEQAYQTNPPQRGDIILFQHPRNDVLLIKRVIGLPNEQVKIENGFLHINGSPLDEAYPLDLAQYSGVWEIPAGHYFVLGDNRNSSSDSHSWGPLPKENIQGKGIMICAVGTTDKCSYMPKYE